jgi:polysaccharide biosynthesis protein PslA
MGSLVVSDIASAAPGSVGWSLLVRSPAGVPAAALAHDQSGLPLHLTADRWPLAARRSGARAVQLRIKHGLDPVGAAALLLVLGLPLLLVALLVKLTSPGPVLFRQPREGLEGAPFIALKFRTMHADAGDVTGVTQTVPGDGRVTPLGRFLRRWNIDELPQLINVLKGEMSLVGPRPHAFRMRAAGRLYDEHVPYYPARLAMRPGITGWAQCNGLRGPTDDAHKARARIDHDLAYVQNFSLWLDLRILVLTLVREVRGTGI